MPTNKEVEAFAKRIELLEEIPYEEGTLVCSKTVANFILSAIEKVRTKYPDWIVLKLERFAYREACDQMKKEIMKGKKEGGD